MAAVVCLEGVVEVIVTDPVSGFGRCGGHGFGAG